jgi:hypothetical protein
MRFQEFVSSEKECILTVSTFTKFDMDEDSPVYLDMGEHKQKWTLVCGVGPKMLELDSSKSGRLYKPSFRQLKIPHISGVPFENTKELKPEQFKVCRGDCY